jgi:hypothetical protein
MFKSVITDKDDALSAAILAHLPFVYHFLCIWHINMNVMKKCKPISCQQIDNDLGDEEIGDNQYKASVDEHWKAFLQFWNDVIGATIEDVFAATWIALHGAYPEPEFVAAIAYPENEWLHHKEKFVHAWTNHHLHFGHRATSKAEGAHALIKRELMVSTNDVVTVVNALVRTLKDQRAARKAALERAKVNLPIKLLIPLFRDIVGKVAPQALHRMLDIRNKQLSTGVATTLPPCTNTMKGSMGLPCVHVIDTYLHANAGSLQVTDFHLQWHLQSIATLPPLDPHLQIREPDAIQPRGRPTGATARRVHTTRREPSGFENEEASSQQTRVSRRKKLREQRQQAADGVDSTQGSDAGSSNQCGGRGRGHGRGDNIAIDTVVEGMPIE